MGHCVSLLAGDPGFLVGLGQDKSKGIPMQKKGCLGIFP